MKNLLKKENIIVAIIMVVIVIFSVIFIGVEPIKDWLKAPITWDKGKTMLHQSFTLI